MPEPIPASIKAELDQTPEWWQEEFDALVRKRIPRDYEYHAGHDLEEIRTYADVRVRAYCIDCGIHIQ